MATFLVTYPGTAATRFDRDYYVNTHLPLVIRSWQAYGLQSAAAFFPSGDGAGTIAVCLCAFREDADIEASLHSSESAAVMADIRHFTDAQPVQSRAAAV